MAIFKVEIVMRPKYVGGYDAGEHTAILLMVGSENISMLFINSILIYIGVGR